MLDRCDTPVGSVAALVKAAIADCDPFLCQILADRLEELGDPRAERVREFATAGASWVVLPLDSWRGQRHSGYSPECHTAFLGLPLAWSGGLTAARQDSHDGPVTVRLFSPDGAVALEACVGPWSTYRHTPGPNVTPHRFPEGCGVRVADGRGVVQVVTRGWCDDAPYHVQTELSTSPADLLHYRLVQTFKEFLR